MKPHAVPLARHNVPPAGFPGALGAVRIIHPFPTLLNVAATAALAFVAAGGTPAGDVLVRMLLVMLCAQSAIGVTNDLFDRELDAQTKPWKPLVSGAVSERGAVMLDAGLIGAAIVIAATLGAASFSLAMLGLACGLAYDARLKRTSWSAVPYMVAIPTLPIWVWVTLGEWDAALWWLVPLGALTGLSLHLANTLPDIESDRANGVEGLAHRLGEKRSMAAGWGAFALALVLSGVAAIWVRYDLRVYLPAVAFGTACLALSLGAFAIRRSAFTLQLGFGALGIGTAVLAAGWLAAVS